MPRTKASVSDRIIEDFLSLPAEEARLLPSYLGTTLRLTKSPAAVTAQYIRKAVTTPSRPITVVDEVAHPPLKVRRPRIARATPPAVPAGDPGPETMTVGEDQ